MDFDFAKVVEASKDNPVFYVQYAHARIASLKRRVAETFPDGLPEPDLALLGEEELAQQGTSPTSRALSKARRWPREPHRIAFYLYDLAAAFHSWWNLGNDQPDRQKCHYRRWTGADGCAALLERVRRSGYQERPCADGWLAALEEMN